MDAKIAKFFLIPVAALVIIAEMYELLIWNGFNLQWYVFPYGFYFGLSALFALLALTLKVALVLGAVFAYLQYSKGNEKLAKTISLALPGIFIFRILIIYIWGGTHLGNMYGLLSLFAFIAAIVNFIIAVMVKPEGYVKTPRQPTYYNQPPVQQYQPPMPPAPQGGQSIPDQLAALQALADNGTLTQTEFHAAKQRIIGS